MATWDDLGINSTRTITKWGLQMRDQRPYLLSGYVFRMKRQVNIVWRESKIVRSFIPLAVAI